MDLELESWEYGSENLYWNEALFAGGTGCNGTGKGSSPVLLDWRGLQLMAKMVLARI
jgi:hypothetical protein